MNWCYYFINLQQKAIFSKNWGGPEKDRFFLVFSGFLFFGVFFSKSFCFQGGLLLLSSFFRATLSSLLPLLSSALLSLLLVSLLSSLLLPLLLFLFQSHSVEP